MNPSPPSPDVKDPDVNDPVRSSFLELAGEHVLVTGGTGFIGRHLIQRLLDAEAIVHASTRQATTDHLEAAVVWHQVDLADRDAVKQLFESAKPKIVLHLASHVAGSRDLSLVAPTLRDNLCSTVHLMEAAVQTGCRRFVQVGSLEEPELLDEPPSSPYAAAKAAAATYAALFHHLYDLPVVTARVFMVYGPGHQDEQKLVPYVIRSLLGGQTPSFSSGTRPVDWVYVEDVAEGLIRLATTPGVEGLRIDLGTGELHTVRQMVECLFEAAGTAEKPTFGGLGDRASEQIRRADAQRTRTLLGWAPDKELAQGVAQTFAWFRTNRS